ncbi:MAG TPA: NDP-sugar synthase [Solirubrobacteraceae bacterium]|jgi:mannose-1-phosphate guanylyltransferase|nr:NDP-sugar synthase [Solirubrobacteraceae bacterium]
MQALILVGGEGTRLRPLTSTQPKPAVPLVNQPFMAYMLEWLRGHGVDDVILSCGFMPDGIRAVLGDGSSLGITLRYIEEPTPLGTGGALKYAEDVLDEEFLMLNGDVLTDIDVGAQLAQHRETGARATLALIGVEDPSAYGLVRLNADHSVRGFLEKPKPEEIDTNLVNAGVYVLHRSVLDGMAPAGTKISIERDLFPTLVGGGLFGYEADGYWMDIGTPDRYLQATREILDRHVHTLIGERVTKAGGKLVAGSQIDGEVATPAVLDPGCEIAAGARIGPHSVLGRGVRLAEGAEVTASVLLEGVIVGRRATVRDSIVGREVEIGADCVIANHVMLGDRVKLGAGNILGAGARISPGVELPAGAIKV